jgi:hypothetical protein
METLLHDGSHDPLLANGDDGTDSLGDHELFTLPPPAQHSSRSQPRPKSQPKKSSTHSKIFPFKISLISGHKDKDEPKASAPSKSPTDDPQTTSPGLLKTMKELDNQDQHNSSNRYQDPSRDQEKATPDKDCDGNFVNSVGGRALDDPSIAYIDEATTPVDGGHSQ